MRWGRLQLGVDETCGGKDSVLPRTVARVNQVEEERGSAERK